MSFLGLFDRLFGVRFFIFSDKAEVKVETAVVEIAVLVLHFVVDLRYLLLFHQTEIEEVKAIALFTFDIFIVDYNYFGFLLFLHNLIRC